MFVSYLFWFLWLLVGLWFLFAVIIILSTILFRRCLWYFEVTILWSFCIFGSCVANLASYTNFASSWLFRFLSLLVIRPIIYLTKASIPKLVSESIISIYLLKLWTKAFFSIRWREHYFKLLYGISDFLFIRCIVM